MERGDDGTRTRNPRLAKAVRYQLRHVPGSVPTATGSVVLEGDGVGRDVHLRLVLGDLDDPTLLDERRTQLGTARLARPVEPFLDLAAAAGTDDVHRRRS